VEERGSAQGVGSEGILLPKIWAWAMGLLYFVSREDAKARRRQRAYAGVACQLREAPFKVACGDK
jgi:hypothetical protein